MSMTFEQPINAATRAMIEEAFGKPAAADDKTLLFDRMATIRSVDMSAIANAARQPVTVELHSEGEIKTMADGTRYRATKRGWVKVE